MNRFGQSFPMPMTMMMANRGNLGQPKAENLSKRMPWKISKNHCKSNGRHDKPQRNFPACIERQRLSAVHQSSKVSNVVATSLGLPGYGAHFWWGDREWEHTPNWSTELVRGLSQFIVCVVPGDIDAVFPMPSAWTLLKFAPASASAHGKTLSELNNWNHKPQKS